MGKILVIGTLTEHGLSKNTKEALSFAVDFGKESGQDINLLIPNGLDSGEIANWPVSQMFTLKTNGTWDMDAYVQAVSNIQANHSHSLLVLSGDAFGKALGGMLSIKQSAGLVSNAIGFQQQDGNLLIKKSVFSGKAYAWYQVKSSCALISLLPHGYGVKTYTHNQSAVVEEVQVNVQTSRIRVIGQNKTKGKTPLTEADVVVSGGRGLKESSNFRMIEELADLLNAATACSRPVADAGWRPHHEHVGQTGIAIRPNVYIAVGISGAIQHLAGVNNSKKIIVINKDPEAPFFKSADYGICGDLFEVLPKLIESIRSRKQ